MRLALFQAEGEEKGLSRINVRAAPGKYHVPRAGYFPGIEAAGLHPGIFFQ